MVDKQRKPLYSATGSCRSFFKTRRAKTLLVAWDCLKERYEKAIGNGRAFSLFIYNSKFMFCFLNGSLLQWPALVVFWNSFQSSKSWGLVHGLWSKSGKHCKTNMCIDEVVTSLRLGLLSSRVQAVHYKLYSVPKQGE